MSSLLVLAACRRTGHPARPGDSGFAPVSGSPAPDASRDDEQPIPEGLCRPATVLSLGRGGAIFDACFDPQSNHTDLVGQRFDPDAMAVGSRVRLARVPGNVVSLAATGVDASIRVAWISHVGDGAERADEFNDPGGGAREISALSLSASLRADGPPMRVHRHVVVARSETERRSWSRSRIELAQGLAGALMILATDAEEPCAAGGQRCASWSIFSVAADGTSQRTRHETTPTPSVEPQSLIRVGDDLAYLRGADAVRNVIHVHSIRAQEGSGAAIPAAVFDPLPDWTGGSLAWTGSAVVALGEERMVDNVQPRIVVRVTSANGASPTRPRASDDPETVHWPVVTARTWRCVGRHPVLRVAWRGGAVDLDPTAPGASIDLSRWVPPTLAEIPVRGGVARWFSPMAWMGRALLAIDGNDRLRRWTCGRDGSTPAE